MVSLPSVSLDLGLPQVGADLEQGMYYGGGSKTQHNPDNQPLPFEFVTAYLRGTSCQNNATMLTVILAYNDLPRCWNY